MISRIRGTLLRKEIDFAEIMTPGGVGYRVNIPLTTYEKLNVDSPLAMLNDGVLRLATTMDWARAMLVLAVTLVYLRLLRRQGEEL